MPDTVSLKVTQASLNQTAMSWGQNMANHYAAIRTGLNEGSDMVTMPELSLTAYDVGDDFQKTDNNRIFEAVMDLAAFANVHDPNMIVTVGAPWRLQLREAFRKAAPNPDILKNALFNRLDLPFNTQISLQGGKIQGITVKSNLFNDGRGYEKRFFPEWSFRDVEEYAKLAGINAPYGTIPIILPDGATVPMGRPLIYVTDRSGDNFIHAQGICEEKWAASEFDGFTIGNEWYEQLNIIPSVQRYLGTKKGLYFDVADASPPSFLKQDQHMALNDQGSLYTDVLVNTDGLGNSGSTFAQTGHRLISQNGRTISAGARMQFGELATTTSIIQISVAPEELEKKAHATLMREFKSPNAAPRTSFAWDEDEHAWDHPDNPDRWIEERVRNQALWTYDYMRKVGSVRSFNASSGGQDSAYNITLDYLAPIVAMHKNGVEYVCDDLNVPYKDEVMAAFEAGGRDAAIKEFMSHYLWMYYYPTNNNSEDHANGARMLHEGGVDENGVPFEGLGGQFHVRSIQDLVTMSAMVFGTENTAAMSPERKAAAMEALSAFVHANPKKHTPEAMRKWEDQLKTDYPELEEVTSVALPGQSIAYENFQARLRTVLIWAAANVHGGMPRANCNLTEAYINNTTAAGDLQGGAMNPNGGLFKDEEQKILRYLETKGLHGIVPPIKALSKVNGNKPTAGLLPMEEGEVVQNDEDTMQATMPQLTIIARAMHHTKINTPYGRREMNAGEVMKSVRNTDAFSNLDENQLFNAVANFYRRWYSGQFKIHMGTVQPTFGDNVDHQTSRRTPNLNGGSKDEIIQMGIDMMFDWASSEGLGWKHEDYIMLQRRAYQDTAFMKEFMSGISNRDEGMPNMHYNLRALYDQIRDHGWNNILTPLSPQHPLQSITLEAA